MQEENSNFVKKLESLHSKTGWTWDEIAKALNVSKSKLFYVKRGERNPVDSLVYRLDQLLAATDQTMLEYQEARKGASAAEPGPQWPQGARPGEDIEERIEKRFQDIEGKMDAIFIVLSELRNAQKSDFRSSEKPKITYPKGHE